MRISHVARHLNITNYSMAPDRTWLLIFDNLEDARLIETYLPLSLSGRGSIIITTQKAHISPITEDFYKIELQPLPVETGTKLLYAVWGKTATFDEERSASQEIASWVGGLPLAIVTVAGYLKCSSVSAAKMLESLKRSSNVWSKSGEGSVWYYEKTLATVFDVALGEISGNSRHLLQIMAFLSPDGIPEELFTQKHNFDSLRFLNNEDE
jgi:hypothetical protein